MVEEKRKTGIDIIGDAPWGMHFCQFYQTKEDLLSILVPYFKAGLENNEFCMWITSEPLTINDAKEAMRKAVPDFDRFLNKGQIEIIPHDNWYLKDGIFELKRVFNAWIDRLNNALAKGYDGMRVTGNTGWLEKRDWQNFKDYEEEINRVVCGYKILVICTYSLDKCGASDIMDVMVNHQFAIIKKEGRWSIVESSERKKLDEELNKAVKDWDNIFNAISDFVFILDKNFTITKANFAFAEALNLKPEELIGKKCYEVLHKTKKPCPECPYMMTKKDKLPHSQEVNDPNIGIPLLVTTAPIFDEKREVCGAVHIAKDISVLKKAGKEILALSKFPSENPSPVLRIAKDGEILYSNKPGLELLANWNVKVGEKAPAKWCRLIKEALESAKPGLQEEEEEEEEVKGKLFSVVISPVIEAGYANLYGHDITERKNKEELISNLNEQLKIILDASPTMIFYKDKENRFIHVNEAVAKASGLSKKEMEGKTMWDLYSREAAEHYWQDDKKVMAAGKPVLNIIEEMKTPKGITWVQTDKIPYRNSKGEVIGIIGFALDITERKRLQEEAAKIKETTILEAMTDGIIVLDMNGNISQCNAALAKMHGFKTSEEMKGINISGLVAERDLQRAMNEVKNIFECGISANFECTGKDKTGKEFPALVNASVLKDEKGNVAGAIGVVRDITEIKRLQEEAAKTKEATLLEAMIDGVAVVDMNGNIIQCNNSYAKMFRFKSQEEMKGINVSELVAERDVQRLMNDMKRCFKVGTSVNFEHTAKDKTGKEFPALVNASVLKDEKGKVVGSIAVLRDITERKKSEEALRESNERFQRAIHATEDGLWEWDIQTNQEFFAPRWCEIVGYSFDDPELPHSYKSWASRIHPNDYDRVMGALNNHLEKGTKYDVDYRHRHKSGEYRWQNSKGQAIYDASGKPIKMVGCISDITEQKLMPEQILASEKLAVMGRLVADVAHEINNPLSIIMAGTQHLEERIKKQASAIPDLEANAKMFGKVKNAINRCKQIVGGLLTSTRPTKLDLGPTAINKVIKESLVSTKNQLKQQKKKVIKALAPHIPAIEADGQRLNQVFINMITNACDAMPEGGELRIATRLQTLACPSSAREAGKGKATASHAGSVVNPAVEIEISDTGEGIRKEDMPKLFTPFFTTKKDGKGVGLGLPIAYGIIKEHGGSISVTSEKGKGTTFTILLPCEFKSM